jgi:hypothetical protein
MRNSKERNCEHSSKLKSTFRRFFTSRNLCIIIIYSGFVSSLNIPFSTCLLGLTMKAKNKFVNVRWNPEHRIFQRPSQYDEYYLQK